MQSSLNESYLLSQVSKLRPTEDVTYPESHKTLGSAQTSVAWQRLWH